MTAMVGGSASAGSPSSWADAREPLVSGGEKIWERLLGGWHSRITSRSSARGRVYTPWVGAGLGGAAANGGGLAALLDYARHGDAIVVVGIDRLGRNAAEVMMTIRDLGERGIVLRSLREGIDTSNATGRMVAGVLASLAELELELGRERRSAAREARRARGQSIGRPKALDASKAALAQRMHAGGETASTIAATLGVSRATVYRVLAEHSE